MDSIRAQYKRSLDLYRTSHYGDEPTFLFRTVYAIKSVCRTIVHADSTSDFNLKTGETKKHEPSTTDLSIRETKIVKILKKIFPFAFTKTTILTAAEFKHLLHSNNASPFPASVTINGDLDLSNETSLEYLPESLHVNGSLTLQGCTNLKELPKVKLRVKGSLIANNCSQLRHITNDLKVGFDLYLTGCTNLQKLPSSVYLMGCRSDSMQRNVYLRGTRMRASALTKKSKVMFHMTSQLGEFEAGYRGYRSDSSIKTAWCEYAQLQDGFPKIAMTAEDDALFSEWLSRLEVTQSFAGQTKHEKQAYASDLINLALTMSEDEKFKELAMDLIREASESCSDKIILGLDNINQLVLSRQAEQFIYLDEEEAEKNLRVAAQEVMLIEELNQYIVNYLQSHNDGESVEVMLAFRIQFSKEYDLSMAKNMRYKRCSGVSHEAYNEANSHIMNKINDESIDKFLESWEPWKQFQRYKSVPSYDALKTCSLSKQEQEQEQEQEGNICQILHQTPEKMVKCNGRIYDHDALKGWYTKHGSSDPVLRKDSIDWNTVRRVDKN